MSSPPSTALVLNSGSDPATLGFPSMLPIELAMGESTPKEICADYGISKDDFAKLCALPAFVKAVKDAYEMVAKEGMFKIKARMQSEALLQTQWQLIHAKDTPANVKADMIKTTFKVAGFEPKESDRTAIVPLQINIQL